MPGRKSDIFFIVVALGSAAFGLMVAHAHHRKGNAVFGLKEKAMLVQRLELTDLCQFTAARYARHPSNSAAARATAAWATTPTCSTTRLTTASATRAAATAGR